MDNKYKYILIFIIILLAIPVVSAAPLTYTNFTSSTSWQAPSGVYAVNVTVLGGGGGGRNGTFAALKGNGGSAASSATFSNIAVTPGTSYAITVGGGGEGGSIALGHNDGHAGYNSTFNNDPAVSKVGGAGGTGTGSPNGANGDTTPILGFGYPNATDGEGEWQYVGSCTLNYFAPGGVGGSGFGAGGGGGAQVNSATCVIGAGNGGAGSQGYVKLNYVINPPPSNVSFTQNESSGAVPLNIQFTDRTDNSPASWNWSFGDGTLSTSQNPTHVYSTPGWYNVSLNVTNSDGISNITTFYKCVIAGQAPQTNSGPRKLYLPFNGTAGSSAIRDYSPSNNSVLNYGAATITTTQSKFGGSALSFVGASNSHLMIPYNDSLVFGSGDFYVGWWQNDTSNNPGTVILSDRRTNYTTVGYIDGRLFGYNPDTLLKHSYGASIISWDLGGYVQSPSPTCKTWNYYVFLRNGTNLQAWKDGVYVGGGGIGTAPFNNTHRAIWIGAYMLAPSTAHLATSPDAMIDDLVMYVGLAPNGSIIPTRELLTNPLASFISSNISGQSPVLVNFTDTSVGNAMTSWNWSFGDGTYSNSQNPNHLYIAVGNYTVTLNATNNFGSSLSSQTITVTNKQIVDFVANATLIGNNLPVLFTDQSTNSTGWAWFFGDERYNNPWTLRSSGPWVNRYIPKATGLRDGSIILVGGFNSTNGPFGDVWRTTNDGVTWTQLCAPGACEFGYKYGPGLVTLNDGSILITSGGNQAVLTNDTWRSIDGGIHWVLMNASCGWTPRAYMEMAALPDGSVVVGGGYNGIHFNDTWRSTDNGRTWTLMNASAPWQKRGYFSMVGLPDNSIVLTGGANLTTGESFGDVWRSTDGGKIWTLINASAPWGVRYGHSVVVMPDKSLFLIAGVQNAVVVDSTWRSTDNGFTWTLANSSNGWANGGRYLGTAAVASNGSVLYMGGITSLGGIDKDTNGILPVGSSLQNPVHSYATFGIYNVSLQVRNTFNYNNTQKIAYIDVENQSLTGFTANITSGSRNMAVVFNVTYTNDGATMWNWSFGDGTWQNGTTKATNQNATHTYTSAGIYSITEIASAFGVTNSTTRTNYITVGNQTFSNLTSNITQGILPDVGVQFDSSNSTNATGWAWFFGDENYTQPWIRENASSGWQARYFHGSVILPDGSIVITSGLSAATYNDTWRSTDNGSHWTLQNSSSGWVPRYAIGLSALQDGSIVLTGGYDILGNAYNETWRSTDQGLTWKLQNASSGWSKRSSHGSIVLPNGDIVIVGGQDGVSKFNETWKSSDKGLTWSLVNASSGWSPRQNLATATTPDGGIFVIGGLSSVYENDTWKSMDGGAHWTLQNASSGWQPYRGGQVVSMPDGSLLTLGGAGVVFYNDTWRSTDSGIHWTRTNISAGYTGRWGYGAVALNNGSIVLIGGYDPSYLNDTWMFNPIGSSLQNPIHTYTTFGRYNVSLRTFNSVSYNDTFGPWYFRVFNYTLSGFYANVTSGPASLSVQFNVTNINDNATLWNWSFGDGTWQNGTTQNATHVYSTPGIYSVREIAFQPPFMTSVGTIRNNYITVGNQSIANFTSNVTIGKFPADIQFTDLSENATGWSWFFGDENYTQPWTLQNATSSIGTRSQAGMVVLLDNSIILAGGANSLAVYNDTWRSTDNGITWTLQNASSGWSVRYLPRLNVLPDGSIVLFAGGFGATYYNDVWRSTDQGVTWKLINASSGWKPRAYATSQVMSDGSIILMGGYNGTVTVDYLNDTWRSTDKGFTWMLMNASSGWTPRAAPFSAALPDNSILLMGGDLNSGGIGVSNNETWRSTDSGAHWTLINASSGWKERYGSGIVTMPDNSVFLFGGFTNGSSVSIPANDSWRSVDNGLHWSRINTSNSWISRVYSGVGLLSNNNIILIGGQTSGPAYFQDSWIFNPTGSSIQNPIHTYPYSGIFNVTLRAFNSVTYNDSFKLGYMTIYNSTVTGFTANVTNGSISHGNPGETSAIMFNVTTPNDNATIWNWSFGDGNWSNGTNQNVTYTYVFPGNFTVTEIASNQGGSNTTTIVDFIHIFDHVIPEFTANVTTGVIPTAVGFNVTFPADSASEWNWSFGDGTWQNGTQQNASHLYTTSGIFTVTEIASNPGDLHNYTLFNYITIYNTTVTGFTANVTTGVEPLAIGFNVTNPIDNATMWNWSFGDGTWFNGTNQAVNQNVTHVYSNGGIYTVTEIASNPASTNTTTIPDYITVYNKTISGFTASPTTGIVGPQVIDVTFNVTMPVDNATMWNWSFGDGTWQNGTNQNVTHTYFNGGNYTIIEIASNPGDSNTTTIPSYITLANKTQSGFTANVTTGVEPLAVGFNVTLVNDNASMWNWSFGDGVLFNGSVQATNQNVSHVYSTGGNYTVIETASNFGDSNDTTILGYILVYNQTFNNFTTNISSGFIPLPVTFLIDVNENATEWNWSFGDNTTFNYTNGTTIVYHTFTTVGNFTINLTTSDRGFGFCTTTVYVNTTYYPPATAFNASPLSGMAPLTVFFTDETLNGPTSWNWSFGDGSYSNQTNTGHTYLNAGVYTVILNTSNAFGFSNFSRNITVTPPFPVAQFFANNNLGADPFTVQFTDASSFTSPVSWYWQFGDGSTSSDQNPSHIFSPDGTYRVNLTVQDSVGSNLSADTLIYVTPSLAPVANFIGIPTSGSKPLTVQFTDLSAGGITGWNWSFGDGNYSNAQNPSHVYVADGQYTVKLVTTNNTFSNITIKNGYINVNTPLADANFTASPTSGNYPLTVQFLDASVCDPMCSSWNWDLDGDGATDSNAQNPVFTYTFPAPYSPKLVVSNGINSGTKIRFQYIIVGPTFIPTTIPQPTGTWIPGYRENNLTVSFKGDSSIDLNNATYLKYWLQNFTATGNFNVYGFVTSLMAPLMHVFGFWIFLIIWGLYIFAVWIRAQDVTLPLIIGILSMGTFGLLFPKEALPVIIIMFVICGAIIVTKLMKDSI